MGQGNGKAPPAVKKSPKKQRKPLPKDLALSNAAAGIGLKKSRQSYYSDYYRTAEAADKRQEAKVVRTTLRRRFRAAIHTAPDGLDRVLKRGQEADDYLLAMGHKAVTKKSLAAAAEPENTPAEPRKAKTAKKKEQAPASSESEAETNAPQAEAKSTKEEVEQRKSEALKRRNYEKKFLYKKNRSGQLKLGNVSKVLLSRLTHRQSQ